MRKEDASFSSKTFRIGVSVDERRCLALKKESDLADAIKMYLLIHQMYSLLLDFETSKETEETVGEEYEYGEGCIIEL